MGKKNPGGRVTVCECNPSTKEPETGSLWGSLASQSISGLPVKGFNVKSCLQKQNWRSKTLMKEIDGDMDEEKNIQK